MLITPHVIRSREEARTVTEEFKDVLNHVVREYGWEIQNLQRQKRRGQEAPAKKAPTAEPQSSIVPQQQEPQKSARKATIVVPADQKAYESLTSSLASFTPAQEPPVPGREVKTPTDSSQQSHVVVLGNKGIEKGPELGKGWSKPMRIRLLRRRLKSIILKRTLHPQERTTKIYRKKSVPNSETNL